MRGREGEGEGRGSAAAPIPGLTGSTIVAAPKRGARMGASAAAAAAGRSPNF